MLNFSLFTDRKIPNVKESGDECLVREHSVLNSGLTGLKNIKTQDRTKSTPAMHLFRDKGR